MQPIDRETQIKLMTNVESRLADRIRQLLDIPEIAAAAKRCAFDETRPAVSVKQLRIPRRV